MGFYRYFSDVSRWDFNEVTKTFFSDKVLVNLINFFTKLYVNFQRYPNRISGQNY